jgi:hypothetical protein
MSHRSPSRRQILAGLGSSAAVLPLLHGDLANADSPKFPTRVVFVYWCNGVADNEFWFSNYQPQIYRLGVDPPRADITSGFTNTKVLAPLTPYESKLIIPCGIGLNVNYERKEVVGGHDTMPFLLTGVDATPGVALSGGAAIGGAGGPSIDQHIAKALNAPTKCPSLELAAFVQSDNVVQGRLCWAARNQPISPDENPNSVFGRLFADRVQSSVDIKKTHQRRKSVLDHIAKQLERYRARMGGDDRVKVEAHLESVYQIERQLTSDGTPSTTCETPKIGAPLDAQDVRNLPTICKLQLDLIAGALACDLTRVASFQLGNSGNQNMTFPWLKGLGLGLEDMGHHTVAHWDSPNPGDSNEVRHARKVAVDNWLFSQLAYLIGRLDAIKEGDGTLLDHTAVVFMNGFNNGGAHDSSPLPIVIAGSANGYFKTGRYPFVGGLAGNQTAEKRDHREVLVAACEAMGVKPPLFDGRSFDPLPGVRA